MPVKDKTSIYRHRINHSLTRVRSLRNVLRSSKVINYYNKNQRDKFFYLKDLTTDFINRKTSELSNHKKLNSEIGRSMNELYVL